ncbi:LCP family protein [Gloeothece verrucosa]|uniref:Cell envelope-related transcriptional attenuator n=1 Tax=Gloeothece verrucosa (strain PCC 7822) TaxID=497965 RepID=E0U5P6_GLOV7|nr:LCP family protein [Gloeothece verrucosa]ADN15887.1 cell envelope-related transcriptional attenuator [Gloeothece verrucosa PCC 7822]
MANSVEKFSRKAKAQTNPSYPHQNTIDDPRLPPAGNGHPSFSKPPRPTKSLSPFYKGLLWGATFSLTAAISAMLGASVTLVSPLSVKLPPLLQKVGFVSGKPPIQGNLQGLDSLLQYRISRPVNVLVMGIDRVPNAKKGSSEVFGGRSDTMLLLRFDPSDHSVRMLSIPRDSRVEIPGVGYTKINDANVHGGPALAARVVSKTLNDVSIDRYVRVTTDAFIELVNLVGGVEVFVPHPMSYRDVTQKLEINLQEGWQTLNGDGAEQFARFRTDQYGDIGRVQRQQMLLKALQKRLYTPAMIPRIPQAMQIVQQYIDTNLSLEEMLALANFGRELKREDIKMVMLPGRYSKKDEFEEHKSYWIIYHNQRDRVMQEYFGVQSSTVATQTPTRPHNRLRIAIQNASDDPGLTQRVVDYLAKQDFHNVYVIQDSNELLRDSEIVVQKGDLSGAQSLKSLLGIGRVEASSTGDLDSDLTLRLGLDAKQILLDDSQLQNAGADKRP